MNNLQDRAFEALNLNRYSYINRPDKLRKLYLDIPNVRQYVLRMLIKTPTSDICIPHEFNYIEPILIEALDNQCKMGIRQPYIYLTIRNGLVTSLTDDEWHVDGFSMNITHLPEQNYIWSNKNPTEYVEQRFDIPKDFDPIKYNINKLLGSRVKNTSIKSMDGNTLYGLDPYVLHKRPILGENVNRCFIRISFTPIEINDINNTPNPKIPTNYTKDGVKEFRDKLLDYDKNKNTP